MVAIIYLSIGFGVWVGLCALRYTQDRNKGIVIEHEIRSYILGFVGGVLLWPLLIFHLEP